MAIREIREYGDDILAKPCKDVKKMTPRLQELVDDMLETMYEASGVGLAAPQVGVLKKIFVVDITEDRNDPHVFVNPKLIEEDGEQEGYEGCLSLPGKSAIVKRPNHVIVEAFDRDMQPFTLECEELMARAVCHELDHLSGIMYVEKMEGELVDNEDLVERDAEEEEED